MAKGNRLRQQDTGDFIPETEKEEKDIAQKAPIKEILLLRDERSRKIVGLLLSFGSIALLLAFISYLFTWKTDQNVVVDSSWSAYFESNPDIAKNWLGLLGAKLAHLFIHRWFGIGSFAFILIFFVVGFRLLVNVTLLPISRMLRYSFFSVIWVSLTMGYIFSSSFHFLGGAFGYHINQWMRGLLGYAGTGMFLILYLLVFLVVVFNINFINAKLRNWLQGKREVAPSEELNVGEPILEETPLAETELEEKQEEEVNEEELDLDINAMELQVREEPEPEAMPEPVMEVPAEEEVSLEETPVEEEPTTEIVLDTAVPAAVVEPELPADGELKLEVIEVPEEEETPEEAPKAEERTHFGLDTEFDPRLELSGYKLPTLDLLKDYGTAKAEVDTVELENNKNLIVETLKNYNIAIAQIKAAVGPTVTLYEIVPEAGVRISKIKNLEDDIALSLAALGIRIIAPIPGRGTIGIEVPNTKPEMVPMRGVIGSSKFQNTDMDLPICLGKTISNEIYITDLTKMPHLLMAGATGQGKSVGINALLVSLLYKKHPAEVKFVLVDPKKVELTLYKHIERHFLAKLPGDGEAIITDTKLVTNTLNSLCVEMDARYDLLKDAGVRNIKEYNAKFLKRKLLPTEGHKYLPYIVVVIDELADLMMTAGKEVEYPIGRLAQLARAIGIHLILATQRPSVNVITGTIKANFPGRIAFRVTSKIDSRTILDGNGADQLIGKGDMLFSNGSEIIRLQCPFVDTPEVEEITEFIGNQRGYGSAFLLPEIQEEGGDSSGHEAFDPNDRDVLFEDAARIVVQTQQGSTSMLQRRLKLGYNRAGRLIDQLEQAGIVGAFEGSKAREVKVRDELELEQLLNNINEN
ncbi:MAG: DNA translocase FtsK [Bacteroidetes bacterium]|nr:MAG: DNA translocase FtsK [Bacteroidota bacterium]